MPTELRPDRPAAPSLLGLPSQTRACLFDLDGVLTQTAKVHARAWKDMFDSYLRQRSERTGEPFVEFDAGEDYDRYVDGKPRADGTRSFLAARGITLPEGTPDDPPDAETVGGLGNRKNQVVQQRIRTDGVEVYEGSVRYLHLARAAGLGVAVVSSSANAEEVLQVTDLAGLLDARIDGAVARERGLPGKPAPDMFLAGADAVGQPAASCAVFEDALSGVAAGRAGGFAIVVGVDRVGQADALREHGADVVVTDLEQLISREAG